MKICHFLSSDTFAGIEQYVDEISNEQSHNHQVIIITNKSILKEFNNNVSKIRFASLGRNSPFGLLRLLFLIKEISNFFRIFFSDFFRKKIEKFLNEPQTTAERPPNKSRTTPE